MTAPTVSSDFDNLDLSLHADTGKPEPREKIIGIGSTVWVFNENRRVYPQREPGRKYPIGGPIWREHWVPEKITGETSRSWVLTLGRKVPKKGADRRMFAFSEDEIEKAAWVHSNRYRLADTVRYVEDYERLREIARLADYQEVT